MQRIGIGPLFAQTGGGVYRYTLNLTSSLSKAGKFDCILISMAESFDETDAGSSTYQSMKLSQSEFRPFTALRRAAGMAKIRFPYGQYWPIKRLGLDLLISPHPAMIGYHLRIPYIVIIHDVMHRYYPDFPEYTWRERRARDLLYRNAAKYSAGVVVDSNTGRNDLVNFYGIPPEKIHIIPLYPLVQTSNLAEMSSFAANEILQKFELPERFLFYPAQFWFHKNHVRLVQALHKLKKQGVVVPFVLTGSSTDTYTFEDVNKVIRELNIEAQIHYLGYVSGEEIVALYKKSVALVFPTLIGPTSIPILEAMSLGTPVVCSHLFEMPDQIGDAGLTFDPFSVEDIADKIEVIWSNDSLRDELAAKGPDRTKLLTPERYGERWSEVASEALGALAPA